MRAVDTNVLVYAEIVKSPFHTRALALVEQFCNGELPWAIPWPCVYEFLKVVTHPRIYGMDFDDALADITAILASPSLVMLGQTDRHREVFASVLSESRPSGNLVHDAHIIALCREHGVSELLSADRDLKLFQGVRIVNPFAA